MLWVISMMLESALNDSYETEPQICQMCCAGHYLIWRVLETDLHKQRLQGVVCKHRQCICIGQVAPICDWLLESKAQQVSDIVQHTWRGKLSGSTSIRKSQRHGDVSGE